MRRLNFLLLVLLLSIFKAQYSYSNVTIDGIVYSIDDASETATVKKQHWVMPSGGYYYANYSEEKVYDRYSGDIHIPATVEIDDKKYKVEIEFNSVNSGLTKRIIHPAELFCYVDMWYVAAFCELRNEIRLFKLKDIKQYRILNEKYAQKVQIILDNNNL